MQDSLGVPCVSPTWSWCPPQNPMGRTKTPRHRWSWIPTTSLNTSSSGAIKTHLSRAAKAQQSLFKLERRSYIFFPGYIWMSKAVWSPWALQGNLSVRSGSVRFCLCLWDHSLRGSEPPCGVDSHVAWCRYPHGKQPPTNSQCLLANPVSELSRK